MFAESFAPPPLSVQVCDLGLVYEVALLIERWRRITRPWLNFPGWGVVGFLFDVDAGIVPEMLPLLRNVCPFS